MDEEECYPQTQIETKMVKTMECLEKSRNCTLPLESYCASDFNTYNNLCTFQIAQCQNPSLEILFKGINFLKNLL